MTRAGVEERVERLYLYIDLVRQQTAEAFGVEYRPFSIFCSLVTSKALYVRIESFTRAVAQPRR